MMIWAIASSLGVSLANSLLSVVIESTGDPLFAKAKEKLMATLKLGKYEAIQIALEEAKTEIVKRSSSNERLHLIQTTLDDLLAAKSGPLLNTFASQVAQTYLTPLESPQATQVIALAYRKMCGIPAVLDGKVLDEVALVELFNEFFICFRERLICKEEFDFLRQYFSLIEERKQTKLLQKIVENTSSADDDFLEIRKAYLEDLARNLRLHTIRGFSPQVGGGNIISLPIDKIFLPLQSIEGKPALAQYAQADLVRQAIIDIQAEIQQEVSWQRQHQLMETRVAQLKAELETHRSFSLSDLLKSPRSVLLGDPGTGKTTTTRYITYALATNDSSYTGNNETRRIPVLIRIANFAKAYERDSTLHLISYLERELMTRPEFSRYIRWEIEQGNCYVVLDGLDEVANPSLRIQITERIQRMVASFGQNYYLITSRIIGYDLSPLTSDFQHTTLQELTAKDKERFIRLWYAAIADEHEQKFQDEGAEQLIDALKAKPQISRMAANPLLLTIMVLMHWRGTKLPSRRVQVYQYATDTLVEYWTIQRGIVDLDAEETKTILAPIAHFILSSNISGVISRQDLLPLFHEAIINQRGCNKTEAMRIGRELLKDLNEHSGLFLERGLDADGQPVYGFLHQTFGEYLAALHMAQEVQEGKFDIRKYVHRSIWYESFLLMAGHLSIYSKPQANALIRDLLNLESLFEEALHRDLLLAADCLGDDVQVQPSLYQEILKKLTNLIMDSTDQVQAATVDRFEHLNITRYREAALVALKEKFSEPQTAKLSDAQRYNLARCYINLNDKATAHSILLQLDREKYGDPVRRLLFEHWPENAVDYLLALRHDDDYNFTIVPHEKLSGFTLGPVSAELIHKVVGENALQTIVHELLMKVENEDDKYALKWLLAISAETVEKEEIILLTRPDVSMKIRRYAAKKLLDNESDPTIISTLQTMLKDAPGEATTIERELRQKGQNFPLDIRFLRDTALIDWYGSAADAIITLWERGDIVAALPSAIHFIASGRYDWRIIEKLIKDDRTNAVGLAVARWLALTPGYTSRFQACEALIEAGQEKDTYQLLQYLAYEYHDDDGKQAIRKLILLEQNDLVQPLLLHLAASPISDERFFAKSALATYFLSPSAPMSNTSRRIQLKLDILEARQKAFLLAANDFCNTAFKLLTTMNTEDTYFYETRDLAFYSLARLAELHEPLNISIPKLDVDNLLNSASPTIRLIGCKYDIQQGHFHQAYQISSDILTTLSDNLSIQLYQTALSIQLMTFKQTGEQKPEAILRALNSEHSLLRYQSIWSLGLLGLSDSIGQLIALLEDEDSKARSMAAASIGILRDRGTVEYLLKGLSDSDEDVRANIAIALGQLCDSNLVPFLSHVLQNDTEDKVRLAAAKALHYTRHTSAAQALASLLKDQDKNIRSIAAHMLVSLADSSILQELLDAFNDNDKRVRWWIPEAIAKIKDPKALKFLIESLADPNRFVRGAAAKALGEIGDNSAITAIIEILRDENTTVRDQAMGALHRLDFSAWPDVIDSQISALKDPNPKTRIAALHIIGDLEAQEAVPSLIRTLHEESHEMVLAWAAWTTYGIRNRRIEESLRENLSHEKGIVREFCFLGLYWLDALQIADVMQALGDSFADLRENATYALLRIKGLDVFQPLVIQLMDRDVKVQKAAAFSLGRLRDSRAINPLMIALRDLSEEVRAASAIALACLEADIAIPYFKQNMNSANALALARMGIKEAASAILAFATVEGDAQKARKFVESLLHLDISNALTLLHQYERQFPMSDWVFLLFGYGLSKLNQFSKAEKYLAECLQMNESDLNLLIVAHCYFEHNYFERTMKYVYRLLKVRSSRYYALLTAAIIDWVRDNKEGAIQLLVKAQFYKPSYLEHIDVEQLKFDYFWGEKATTALKELMAFQAHSNI